MLEQSSTELPRAPFPSLQTHPSSVLNSTFLEGDGISTRGPEHGAAQQSVENVDINFEGASNAIEIAESENPSVLVLDNVSSSSSTASANTRNAIV
jgi:hypothetical protein